MQMAAAHARRFILSNTALAAPPHVPEIVLHLAHEAHALWHRTEEELQQTGLQPPFWAFAWAGGQGLARYILDHPHVVRAKSVLDFASGSGLVAIAAAKAHAAKVVAAEIDPFAAAAISLNARANKTDVQILCRDIVGQEGDWDLVLAGDVFYDRTLAEQIMPWFDMLHDQGATVLIGDPGRHYLPASTLVQLAVYKVPVTRALEDAEIKNTSVWLLP